MESESRIVFSADADSDSAESFRLCSRSFDPSLNLLKNLRHHRHSKDGALCRAVLSDVPFCQSTVRRTAHQGACLCPWHGHRISAVVTRQIELKNRNLCFTFRIQVGIGSGYDECSNLTCMKLSWMNSAPDLRDASLSICWRKLCDK